MINVSAHAAILTIDLSALAANWRRLAARAAPGECGAVVKADAYGLGIETAVPALAKAGCRTFFVAHVSEGIRARAAAADADIYVLNGLDDDLAAYRDHGLRPVLGTLDEVERWKSAEIELVRRTGQRHLAPAVHVDTGMNRLGIAGEAFVGAWQRGRFGNLAPALVMSHFVESEIPNSPVTVRQISTFAGIDNLIQTAAKSVAAFERSNQAIAAQSPAWRTSLRNSSGLFLEGATCGLARPGYALYGGNPTPGRPNPMKPVIRLGAPIIQINRVKAGEAVGYNGNFVAARESIIATISCGYADGYPRNAGNRPGRPGGTAIVAGREVPFAGNVSMDLITLDISDLPEGAVKPGDLATLIGDSLDIDRVGAAAGTIGYEILTNLGRRYRRIIAKP